MAVDRTMLFWTLGLFFGASIGFRAIQNWTEDESLAVTIAAELVLLAVLIGGIVYFVRRDRRG